MKNVTDASNCIEFIPYRLNTLTKKETMREVVIQQNIFLNETNIVPYSEPWNPIKKVSDILRKLLYFTGVEPTSKKFSEG